WALNLTGGLTEPVDSRILGHIDPAVREWTVRLLGDRGKVSAETAKNLANMAVLEPDAHVRAQLASTARRLRAEDDLAIVAALDEGVKGRSLIGLPKELITAMRKAGVKNEILSIRLGDAAATAEALKVLENPNADRKRRLRIMEALGDVDAANADQILSDIAT